MYRAGVLFCSLIFGCANFKNAPNRICVCKADLEKADFDAKLEDNKKIIVFVVVKNNNGQAINAATGFVYDKSGLIFTARHVLNDIGGGSVEISFKAGEKIITKKVRRFYLSAKSDLALLQVDYQFKSQARIRTKVLESGEDLYAIGYLMTHHKDFNLKTAVAVGYGKFVIYYPYQFFLGPIPMIDTLQVSTIAISYGYSGGPVFDRSGRVVGLLSMNRSFIASEKQSWAWSVRAEEMEEIIKNNLN